MRHIVWDWNGTLYDDLDVIIGAANDSLAVLGVAPIDADGYRDSYDRPIHRFYDRLLGRPITPEELEQASAEFFRGYHRRRNDGRLSRGVPAVLGAIDESEDTQSLLSMAREPDLLAMTQKLGVHDYMALVQGSIVRSDGRKAAMLAEHLGRLGGLVGDLSGRRVVVIGDSIDDAEAAREAGVDAVLYDGGSHHLDRLSSAGYPVAGSIAEAVALA